jgi:hypothetical protein
VQEAGTPPPNVTQTIVNGTLGSPAVFSVLLLACAVLMGWSISKMYDVQDAMRNTNTELRILQVHTQDLNAILLRKGYISPGDIHAPTSAEHIDEK